ncbi:MAG: cupin domain-containing protein [Chloroflexi bacterium]|nr:cupin domain-containing protein [Chloroflexota bacterium]
MTKSKHVGRTSWPRESTVYERYMDEQGVPVHRPGFGVRDVRDVALGQWDRLGVRGAFIELEGLLGFQGIHLIEVDAGDRTRPERHVFEEFALVVEGRGTLQVGTSPDALSDIVEWQPGSVVTLPLNAWHAFEASGGPALILFTSNAPLIMQLFQSRAGFIFDNSWSFTDRYTPGAGFFEPVELTTDPNSGRAVYPGGFLRDAVSLELPFDGQRGEGYRHVELFMRGTFSNGFVAEYPQGGYSKTHSHGSGPVLICLKGAGYTLAWPRSAGTRPWESGQADQIVRVNYEAGGIVSAAPGGGDWFHAHFGASEIPMRVLAHLGATPLRVAGKPGDLFVDTNQDIREGGTTIGYADEDPMIRTIFKGELEKHGVPFGMPDHIYE